MKRGILLFLLIASPVFAQEQLLTLCGEGAGGLPSVWERQDGSIAYTNGLVGIGTNNPQSLLHVNGAFQADRITLQGEDLEDLFVNENQTSSISAEMLQEEAIRTGKIADSAVTTGKIAPDAVTTQKIKNGTIITEDLADAAITGAKIASNSINSAKIADGTISANDLGTGSVGSDEIQNGAVGLEKIDSAEIQRRVDGSCDPGQALSSINEDGSVNCSAASTTLGVNDCYVIRPKHLSTNICKDGFYKKASYKWSDDDWDGYGSMCCRADASVDVAELPTAEEVHAACPWGWSNRIRCNFDEEDTFPEGYGSYP